MLQEYSGTTESTGGGLGVAAVRGTPFLQGCRPGSEQYCLGRMSSVIPELECKCCMLQEYGGMEESTGGGLGVVAVRGTPFLQG